MIARLAAVTAISLLVAGTSQAAVVSFTPNTALTSTPVTINLGGALYSFTSADTGSGIGAAVSTGATAQVAEFFGGLTDFEAGATIDGSQLFGFSAFPTATLIPNSAADDFIGLFYPLGTGTRFAYAEVNGPTLVSYGVETSSGVGILTGATAVPEPASAALLAFGVIALLALARRKAALAI